MSKISPGTTSCRKKCLKDKKTKPSKSETELFSSKVSHKWTIRWKFILVEWLGRGNAHAFYENMNIFTKVKTNTKANIFVMEL